MVRSVHSADLHSTPHASHDAEPLHDEVHAALHDEWREPRNLDAPPARPGYVQRWVRVEDRDGKDNLNYANKFREGWRPRPMETIPEELRETFPSTKHASLGDVVMVGGLVLCEMPRQIADSRNRQVRNRINRQNQAVATDAEATSRQGVARGMAPIVRDEKITVSRREPVIQEG